MKKHNWVDFKALKARVHMTDVLGHYGVLDTLQQRGQRLVGPCPLHHGTNPQQFSVSLEKNVWHCFGDCHQGGNVLDFVARHEDVDLRAAALTLQGWFPDGQAAEPYTAESQTPVSQTPEPQTTAPPTPAPAQTPHPPEQRMKKEGEKNAAETETPPVNTPLTFVLKNLDRKHAYLAERGCTPEVMQAFGLGYCKRGMMKGRVVIPIHNATGELVAYAGRWPGDDPPEGEGKYKLPAGFLKSREVFHLHRAREHAAEHGLIVVEGFFDVLRLWQANIRNAVALMGSQLSEEQERLIVEAVGPHGTVALMFDEDEAGWACRDDALARLSRSVFVKVIQLGEEGRQPDQLSESELQSLCSPHS